jgi:hypothetical protein
MYISPVFGQCGIFGMRWSKEREEDVEWQLTGNEEKLEGYIPGGTSFIHFLCTAICVLCML